MLMQNYCVQHKTGLIRQFDTVIELVRPVITDLYGAVAAEAIVADSRIQFESILPALPNVGGRANGFTNDLLGTAWLLALYKALKVRERPLNDIVDVSMRLFQAYLARYPAWLIRLIGWFYKPIELALTPAYITTRIGSDPMIVG